LTSRRLEKKHHPNDYKDPGYSKQDKIAIDVDVRNYTKYLLREGTLVEKRELLGCLQSKLFLKDKKVTLE